MTTVGEPSPGLNHVHWHRQVAETKTHVYFQCRCGSRSSGRRPGASRSSRADADWLSGANEEPR